MHARLLEALEAAKEAASDLNDAAENLQSTFDQINEEMCAVEMDYHIRELIVKMLNNEPILEQGTITCDLVDLIVEALPEEDDEDEKWEEIDDY